MTLLDTADFYGNGESEQLVARAVAGRREKVFLSVKFGVMRGPNGQMLGLDARPAAVKNFAAYSLKRLGVDVIDVYRPARLDPDVPIEDTVGAIAELIQAGYVRYVGLSEVEGETIRRAHAVHPIADVQMEYSLATRSKVGRTPAQVCLAWVLAQEPTFVPIAGARTPAQLDLLDAVDRPLSVGEKTELEALLPKGAIRGTRYPEAQMASLDSER